jgi:hypothetical protein
MRSRTRRHLTLQQVPVVLLQRLTKAYVVDISETGARLRGITGAHKGDKITITGLLGRVEGRVQWASGDTLGMAFAKPVAASMVHVLRFGAKPNPAARYSSFGMPELG